MTESPQANLYTYPDHPLSHPARTISPKPPPRGTPAQEDPTLPKSPKPRPSAYPSTLRIGDHRYQVTVQRRVAGRIFMGHGYYRNERFVRKFASLLTQAIESAKFG